jgi:hypothetical protein
MNSDTGEGGKIGGGGAVYALILALGCEGGGGEFPYQIHFWIGQDGIETGL